MNEAHIVLDMLKIQVDSLAQTIRLLSTLIPNQVFVSGSTHESLREVPGGEAPIAPPQRLGIPESWRLPPIPSRTPPAQPVPLDASDPLFTPQANLPNAEYPPESQVRASPRNIG